MDAIDVYDLCRNGNGHIRQLALSFRQMFYVYAC